MKVAVIGCGPAGLAATHAAAELGAEVVVYAPKKQTPQRGPILMQRAIPGINNEKPEGYIRQIVIGGSVLDYRLKLYGDINISINGDILQHGYAAWRVQETYDKLWQIHGGRVVNQRVTGYMLDDTIAEHYDLAINTAPAPEFCMDKRQHEFAFKEIAVKEEASYPNQPANSIVFNAYPDIDWVRSSRVFDAEVTEWDITQAPRGSLIIKKPLSTNCDCHPHVFRAGRFGSWHNENWIDTAYFDTFRIISSIMSQKEWDEVI